MLADLRVQMTGRNLFSVAAAAKIFAEIIAHFTYERQRLLSTGNASA